MGRKRASRHVKQPVVKEGIKEKIKFTRARYCLQTKKGTLARPFFEIHLAITC